MKYVRKPVEVEAIQWDGTENSRQLLELFAGPSFEVIDVWVEDPDATAACRSDWHGGTWIPMYQGDYVVIDAEGHLFPLRKVLFEETYEPKT